jgi:hypothetical protein
MLQCTETDYSGKIEYYFVNNSSHNIKIDTYTRYGYISNLEISAGDTLFEEVSNPLFADEQGTSEEYFPPDILGDTATVTFDSKYYLLNINDSCFTCSGINHSLFCFKSYDCMQVEDRYFKYYFVFTEEDYNNAVLNAE